jgi:iron complex outermembrane receptor protein
LLKLAWDRGLQTAIRAKRGAAMKQFAGRLEGVGVARGAARGMAKGVAKGMAKGTARGVASEVLRQLSRLRRKSPGFGILSALSLCTGALAQAQAPGPQQAPDGASGDDLSQVIITGSRIARSGFDTPSPVTVMGAEELRDLAVTNIGAIVSQLPAFRASTNPATNGFGSFNVGAQIVNLRALGVTRNLILVDGRRFAPTTREGSADLNLIPSMLIERTDIVTGGASAAYGSDAVAGVVNVILNRTLSGLQAQLDYGISNEGDGDNYHATMAGGADLLGGRGHFVLGGEFEKQQGIGNCFERDWCRPSAIVTNAGFNAGGTGNGLPNFVRSDTNAGYWMTTGGVVAAASNPAAIRNMFGTGGIQFDANGNAVPYTPGQIVGGTLQLGGEIVPAYSDTNLMVPVKRYTLYGHADLDITDNVQGFFEASYGYVDGSVLQSAFFDTAITIRRDNPFIPANLRAVLDANPDIQSFTMGRLGDDLARGFSTSTAHVYRATTGLSGKFGDSSWTWDAYYQYGRTSRLQTVENNRIQGNSDPALANSPTNPVNFARAVDAVLDTETVITPETGSIVCRSTLSPDPALRAATADCVPLNLFGTGRFSQAAKDYVYGTLREDIDIDQNVIAANAQGNVAELWAGPLQLAGGLEFRRDKIDVLHDPLSNVFAYFQNFGADYSGTAKVYEGYLEMELPLLRDKPAAQRLDLNVAGRHARYEIDGFGSYLRTSTSNDISANTWKASLSWQPVEWLRLRGTRSRDIRAPNFADLYLASASSFAPVLNRFTGGTQFPTTLSGGSPNLDAERANTTTFGFVFQPVWGWSEGLQLSVDYYDISVDGYIASPGGGQFIVDRCFAGNPLACSLITFGPGQSITQVRNVSLNLDELVTRGQDIEVSWRRPLESLGGNLSVRLLASHVQEATTRTFGIAVDRAGQTGALLSNGMPDWLLNAYVTFAREPFSVTLQGRFIDSGVIDATRIDPGDPGYSPTSPSSTNDNHVASAFYANLFGSVNLPAFGGQSLQVFTAINNLFDKVPPFAPEGQYPTNPTYFDQIGRTYRLGVRIDF